MLIVGIDCATDPKKVGMAAAERSADSAKIVDLRTGGSRQEIVEVVSEWISGSATTLLALDSPLGWPAPLGRALVEHSAGEELKVEANALFRRGTDRAVRDEIGKQSLDVGADRIARTARSTLGLMQDLREKLGIALPLAWSHGRGPGAAAIEVYPAATLLGHSLRATGYKGPENHTERLEIARGLAEKLEILPRHVEMAELNADLLDALACVLAGVDFLNGDCVEPGDMCEARKEGWIWFRKLAEHGVRA